MRRKVLICLLVGSLFLCFSPKGFCFSLPFGNNTSAEKNTKNKKLDSFWEKILKLHENGKTDAVIKNARRYLNTVKEDAKIWNVLGRSYMKKGNFLKAENAFKKALNINLNINWVDQKLAQVYLERVQEQPEHKKKLLAKATRHINKALESNNINAYTYITKAKIYSRKDNENKALKMYKKAFDIEPSIGWIYRKVSDIYLRKAKNQPKNKKQLFKRATSHINKALKLQPKNKNFYIQAISIYSSMGNNKQALELINKAIDLNLRSDYFKNKKNEILKNR